MGQIREYECGCGYKKKLFIGCGMNAVDPETVRRLVPPEVFDRFSAELEAGGIEDFIIGHAVIACPQCRELSTAADLVYKTESGGDVRYTAPCGGCGSETAPEKDTSDIICPRCGGKMIFRDIGHWD